MTTLEVIKRGIKSADEFELVNGLVRTPESIKNAQFDIIRCYCCVNNCDTVFYY